LAEKNEYVSRINRTIDYIDRNLSNDFTLKELSDVACFSKYHFHRIFYSAMGETLFQYIQRLRMEKSASMLTGNPDMPITEIAMQCGISSSALFSRTFKSHFKMSPSEWRNGKKTGLNAGAPQEIKAGNCTEDYSKFILHKSGSVIWNIDTGGKKYFVEVKDFPETVLAYVRHIGRYKGDAALFDRMYSRLLNWAAPRNLINEKSLFINIYHDAPEITDDDKLRLSVCINVPENTVTSGEIGKMVLNAGKYAFARFSLGEKDYQAAWDWVYCSWLPQSGYQPGDGYPFELIHTDGDSEGNSEINSEGKKHRVDICMPVKPL
jgi:AraC family transcriptional regulator